MLKAILILGVIILAVFVLYLVPENDLRNLDKYPEDKP